MITDNLSGVVCGNSDILFLVQKKNQQHIMNHFYGFQMTKRNGHTM